MNNKKDNEQHLQRVHESFLKEIDEIKLDRVNKGLDPIGKPLSFREVTSALPRHNFWKQIKDDMKKLDRIKFNKRAGISNVIGIGVIFVIILVVGFMVVLMSSLWNTGFSSITSSFQGIESTAETNISYYAGDVVFGNYNVGFSTMSWISYSIIFAMFLGVIIGMFVVRNHPGYFALFIFGSVIFLMTSIFISRTYEDLYNDPGVLGTSLQTTYFTSSWMLIHSPELIAGIAFVGSILMFVMWNRDPEQGGI